MDMKNEREGTYISGDGRVLTVEEIARHYRDCVNTATPTSARIKYLGKHQYAINCKFSTTDCDSLESVKTSKSYAVTTTVKDANDIRIGSLTYVSDHQLIGETMSAISSNGRYQARLKCNSLDESRQYLEIWDGSKLLRTIDIKEIDAHGTINTDPVFSSMSWYPYDAQDKLMYVCQKKAPKYQSFFKQSFTGFNNESKGATFKGQSYNLGGDHQRVEDWGECLPGIEHTIIVVIDVGNNFAVSIQDLPNYSCSNCHWMSNLRTVATAYKESSRRLGLIYCNNRPSSVVVSDWSSGIARLVLTLRSTTHALSSPRVSHSGDKFIYMANPVFGAHMHAVRLHVYDMVTDVDHVLTDGKEAGSELFVDALLEQSWTTDDKKILFVKLENLDESICLYNLETKKMISVKFPTTGVSVLDFRYDMILAKGSQINSTPTLYVSALNHNQNDPRKLAAWHQIETSDHRSELEFRVSNVPTSDGLSFLTTILVQPNIEELRTVYTDQGTRALNSNPQQLDLPTVVMLHGGPHSSFSLIYYYWITFYARLGIQILLVNYRGSTGIDEEYVNMTRGAVGKCDVDDCLQAIRYHVKNKSINPERLSVMGGSHGGFLACHLSCQTEFNLKCAVIRNPVTDLSTCHATSDIPDWCYFEGLGQELYSARYVPTSEDLRKLYECSPISRCGSASVPTLMCLGSQDRRVRMFQGERWYDMLKANGVKSMCKIYADRHDGSKVPTMTDTHMSQALWILENNASYYIT